MKRREIIRQLTALNIAHDPTAPKAELLRLLTASTVTNKISRSVNFSGGRGKIEVTFNAAKAEEPVEILICEEIGKDAWSGEGFCLKDLRESLADVSRSRPLNFLLNTPGGSVSEGVSIRNWLSGWVGEITETIIGIAASAGSWCIPANKVRAYKNSQMFLHRSMGIVFGNVDEMQRAIEFLGKTDNQIAEMLADQSGGTVEEMLDLMTKETLLTGQEALELGFVDELIDGEAKNQFTTEWLNSAKQKLAALNTFRSTNPANAGGQGERTANNNPNQENTMNLQQKLALLNKRGITPPANCTEAQADELLATSNAARKNYSSILNKWKVTHDAENLTDLQLAELVEQGKPQVTPANNGGGTATLSDDDRQSLAELRNERAEARKEKIRNRLEVLASEGRITVNQIEDWEREAIAVKDGPNGNPILNTLAKNQPVAPGLPAMNEIVITGASFADVQKHIIANSTGFLGNFLGAKAVNKVTDVVRREIGTRAMAAADMIAKNKKAIVEMWNSNSIDSALQRQVILQDMLEAYALRLIVLQAFSVKYDFVPLQGTDVVVVPYFPLQTNASVQFVKGTGYTTANDWTENSRSITIGGDGDSATSGANATAGTAKDRLYQRIDFTSYDMRRQPYLNVAELCKQAADKLGVDVLTQIISRVVVTGNFGAAVKTVAAALFTPDDVADLSEYADTAQWPEMARSLVLQNTYKTPLLKDNTFKQYLSYGATDPIRKAQIQEAYGFENMYFVPLMTNYTAANVAGWINHKSAVLCGFAPIMPAEGVRALLSAYEVIVNPASGCVLEYRKMANATTDTEQEIFQSCFGAGKGVDAALKIIKNA